jgi:hypothetical protein
MLSNVYFVKKISYFILFKYFKIIIFIKQIIFSYIVLNNNNNMRKQCDVCNKGGGDSYNYDGNINDDYNYNICD